MFKKNLLLVALFMFSMTIPTQAAAYDRNQARAVQAAIDTAADGSFGPGSIRAAEAWLDDNPDSGLPAITKENLEETLPVWVDYFTGFNQIKIEFASKKSPIGEAFLDVSFWTGMPDRNRPDLRVNEIQRAKGTNVGGDTIFKLDVPEDIVKRWDEVKYVVFSIDRRSRNAGLVFDFSPEDRPDYLVFEVKKIDAFIDKGVMTVPFYFEDPVTLATM